MVLLIKGWRLVQPSYVTGAASAGMYGNRQPLPAVSAAVSYRAQQHNKPPGAAGRDWQLRVRPAGPEGSEGPTEGTDVSPFCAQCGRQNRQGSSPCHAIGLFKVKVDEFAALSRP